MTFNTPNGTRGAKQPSAGRLMRWFNGWNMKRIRQQGGKVMGMDALVLTTVGRKSGAERSTPVAFLPDGDNAWLIAASANGAANNPAWYYNIAAHPDQVRVELAGRKVGVVAEQLHGQAREDAWRRITNELPRFAKYEEKTDREIPVIRLQAR
ncbi:nitroreductase/quinone reductase family protein [Mycobacterium colombiense]|nr:nitroreductase/quinone reductase family protein [Mycobacterium colombiense]